MMIYNIRFKSYQLLLFIIITKPLNTIQIRASLPHHPSYKFMPDYKVVNNKRVGLREMGDWARWNDPDAIRWMVCDLAELLEGRGWDQTSPSDTLFTSTDRDLMEVTLHSDMYAFCTIHCQMSCMSEWGKSAMFWDSDDSPWTHLPEMNKKTYMIELMILTSVLNLALNAPGWFTQVQVLPSLSWTM